jgi:hypothetical protein
VASDTVIEDTGGDAVLAAGVEEALVRDVFVLMMWKVNIAK